jgi:superfamily II DNA or RNA helicase
MIVLHKYNEVFFKLDIGISESMELKEYLSCFATNYKFHPLFKSGRWNGKISSYNHVEKTIPIGLLPEFVEFCETFRYTFSFGFDRTTAFGKKLPQEFLSKFLETVFPPECNFYPRDYQEEAIHLGLNNKRGIILASVGAGKSIMIYSAIRYLTAMKKKTILIVPNVSLVEQMYSDFKDYGWEDIDKHVTRLYSGQDIRDTDVLITTWQSVYKKGVSFFSKYNGLIIDEVHSILSTSIQSI